MLAAGCISAALLEQPQSTRVVVNFSRTEVAFFTITTGTEARQWRVTSQEGATGRNFQVTDSGPSSPADCKLAGRAALDWPAAKARLDSLLPDDATDVSYAYMVSNPEYRLDYMHTPSVFQALFTTSQNSQGSYAPDFVSIGTRDGLPERITASPEAKSKILQTLGST